MKNCELSYNDVSEKYNERYKHHNLIGIQNELVHLIKENHPQNILEVGCGTGRWLTSIPTKDSRLFGMDYSIGMLSQINSATNKICRVNGDANHIPFKNSSFNFVYCVNAIHHFGNPKHFMANVINILCKNNIFIIIGIDPNDINYCWYAYDYFPRIREYDLKRFPSFDDLINMGKELGFTNFELRPVEYSSNKWIGEEVFTDIFLQKHNSSQLMTLTQAEYSEGMAKINNSIAHNPSIVFRTHLTFKLLSMSLL